MARSGDQYDVIVVGGGGSGLAAAYWAADRGGRVLLLERRPRLGGTTAIAVGSFTAAGTSLQHRRQIDDDPDAHADDAGKFAAPEIEARNHDDLRRYFLREAATTYEWLESLGLRFVGPSPEPPNRTPRMHNVVPGGWAYIAALELAARRRGATILCNAEVTSLTRDGKRIAGVEATIRGVPRNFDARRGVILAAGDYAANAALIARYKGEQFQHIEAINPQALGGGHLLAEAAGAQLVNMDITYGPELRFVAPTSPEIDLPMPLRRLIARAAGWLAPRLPGWLIRGYAKRLLVTWQHPENALFDDGAILVNAQGERFTNERASPEREIDVAAQPDKVAYLLLDRRLVERYSAWPHFISTAPDIAYAYVADYQRLRKDVTIAAETVEQLAVARGMDPLRLRETVNRFNRYVRGEEDDPFGRRGDAHPLGSGPWVLLGPAKAYFTTTEGGPTVNHRLEVLDAAGQPIPGLYAVGQNGLGGMILWGHGLHIAWALTSGRLAGISVMSGTR